MSSSLETRITSRAAPRRAPNRLFESIQVITQDGLQASLLARNVPIYLPKNKTAL